MTCCCTAIRWVVGIEVACRQTRSAHALQYCQHHIAFITARRTIRIKAQQRVSSRLLQLQEPTSKWVAAVVRQSAVSQQIRVVQHVSARAHRKVRDRHRIGFDRRVRPVAVGKRAATFNNGPVLLRCQHKLVYAGAACQSGAQHAAYCECVVSFSAAQRCLGYTVVLTFCTRIAGCVIAYRDGVVARATQRRHGRLAVTLTKLPLDTNRVVIVTTIERVGLVDFCAVGVISNGFVVVINTQTICTRSTSQSGCSYAIGTE